MAASVFQFPSSQWSESGLKPDTQLWQDRYACLFVCLIRRGWQRNRCMLHLPGITKWHWRREASHTPVIIALREYASCMLRKDTAFVPQVSWADEEGVATLALIRPIWSAGWFNKLHGMRAPFIPCISRPSKKQVHLYRLTESYNVWSAPSLKTYNPRTIVQTYSWKCRCVCVCVREDYYFSMSMELTADAQDNELIEVYCRGCGRGGRRGRRGKGKVSWIYQLHCLKVGYLMKMLGK